MAIKYVYSGATGTNDGSSWTNAWTALSSAVNVASGDSVYVHKTHSEVLGAATTYTFANNNVRVICVDKDNSDALSTGALISTSGGNYNLTMNGAIYCYGLILRAGVGATGTAHVYANSASLPIHKAYEMCQFELASTGAASKVVFNSGSYGLLLKNCQVKFAVADQSIQVTGGKRTWVIGDNKDILVAGSAVPTRLFVGYSNIEMYCSGMDVSQLGPGKYVCSTGGYPTVHMTFHKCKLGANVTPFESNVSQEFKILFVDCDSADTVGRLYYHDAWAESVSETTIVRTGGASNGTNTYSVKMSTRGDVTEFYPARSLPIVFYNPTEGSQITATVEILHDSATNLKDDEVWIEVEALGTNGCTGGNTYSDTKATILTAAADQAAGVGTGSWTTTGLTNPNSQKISVSFTPQGKGYFNARLCLGKVYKTVYYDPKVVIS